MLQKVFEFQRSLMEKLAPVETELGYTPPPVPLDFTSRAGQDWFRLMSWYLQEEMVEVWTATPQSLSEELADCLHFAVELCILAGITSDRIEALRQADQYEGLPWTYQMLDVSIALGLAVNMLKAKHWKRNPQVTDLEQFQAQVAQVLYRLLMVIRHQGHDFHAIYMAKHRTNEERIQNKY